MVGLGSSRYSFALKSHKSNGFLLLNFEMATVFTADNGGVPNKGWLPGGSIITPKLTWRQRSSGHEKRNGSNADQNLLA